MMNNLDQTNHAHNNSDGQTEFERSLKRLNTLCHLKRDIVDLAHGDPAFDTWFLDPEAARSSALVAAEAVKLTAPRPPLDQQFRKGGPFTNSLVTRCFTRFLSAASELIAAERDLSGYSGQDPAVDAWIRDAELAFSQTSAVLDELLSMPGTGAVETRLKRVGALFRFVMLSDDPTAVANVRHEAAAALSYYHTHAAYGLGQRTRHMIVTGLQQLEAYLALEDGLLPEDAVPGALPMAVLAEVDAPVSAAA